MKLTLGRGWAERTGEGWAAAPDRFLFTERDETRLFWGAFVIGALSASLLAFQIGRYSINWF